MNDCAIIACMQVYPNFLGLEMCLKTCPLEKVNKDTLHSYWIRAKLSPFWIKDGKEADR